MHPLARVTLFVAFDHRTVFCVRVAVAVDNANIHNLQLIKKIKKIIRDIAGRILDILIEGNRFNRSLTLYP